MLLALYGRGEWDGWKGRSRLMRSIEREKETRKERRLNFGLMQSRLTLVLLRFHLHKSLPLVVTCVTFWLFLGNFTVYKKEKKTASLRLARSAQGNGIKYFDKEVCTCSDPLSKNPQDNKENTEIRNIVHHAPRHRHIHHRQLGEPDGSGCCRLSTRPPSRLLPVLSLIPQVFSTDKIWLTNLPFTSFPSYTFASYRPQNKRHQLQSIALPILDRQAMLYNA